MTAAPAKTTTASETTGGAIRSDLSDLGFTRTPASDLGRQDGLERGQKPRVTELVAELDRLLGVDPLAAQDRRRGFTEDDAQYAFRRLEPRRPIQDDPERLGELCAGYSVRRNRVHRSAHAFVVDGKQDHA